MTKPTHVTFEVVGNPMTQGNKTPMLRGGRAVVVEGRDKTGREKYANWRNAVADAGRDVAAEVGTFDGPLSCSIVVRLRMPKSRKAADRLRRWRWCDTNLDSDKLARSIGDSLTNSGLINDDARIAHLHVSKIEVWESWTGAEITIARIYQDQGSPPSSTTLPVTMDDMLSNPS